MKKYLSNYITIYKESALLKNIGLLTFGTIIAKIISFSFYPFITRLYTPEEFGIYSIFSSTVIILYPLCSFYYQLAIPIPKNEKISSNIIFLIIIITLLSTISISIFMVFLSESVFNLFNIGHISQYWFLIMLCMVLMSFNEVFINFATRKSSFIPVTISKLLQAIIFSGSSIALYFVLSNEFGLLLALIIQLFVSVVYFYHYFYNDFKMVYQNFDINYVLKVLVLYKAYPYYRFSSEFIIKSISYLPIIFFFYQYGPNEAGQIGLSLVVISVPLSLIGQSIGKAYYAEIVSIDIIDKPRIRKLTIGVYKNLIFLGIIPSVILVFAAPVIFEILFGANWIKAGTYTAILSFLSVLKLATTPIFDVFNVINRLDLFFKINIFGLVTILLIFVLSAVFKYDDILSLILYVTCYKVYLLSMFWSINKVLK